MHASLLFALDVLALVGGKVHTLVPGAVPLEATILIEGAHVTAVAPDAALPDRATVVDVTGMHVVPGLTDALAFHDPEHDVLYTAAGVTMLCDHGNELARIFDSRELAERDARCGPALTIAGAVFDGDPPATNAAIIVRTPEATRAALNELMGERIDFVAFHSQLSLECWKELCVAAKERELGVWGPRLAGHSLTDALAGGQRGFVGLETLLPPGKSWDDVQESELDASSSALVEHAAALVPQLSAYASRVEDQGDEAPELAELGPQYSTLWQLDLEQRRSIYTDEMRHKAAVVVGRHRALLLALHRAGVRLVPGSGAPHPWLMPGSGLLRELAEWQAVGIPAGDCLAAATRGAAEAFGLSKERGTIEAGKLADLVVLRGDPTEDVHALAEVEGVVLRGRWLDRGALDDKLAAMHTELAAARALASQPIEVEPPPTPEGTLLLSGRSETMTAVGRIAAERFAVVREVDQTLTFCGRRRILGAAGASDRQVDVRQRVRAKELDSFEVKVSASGRELALKGQRVAGQWRVERRFDGQFVDIQAARESLVAVDCGSITTYLLLGHTREAGQFPVVRLDEGLQLEVVRWDLALDEDGDHAFRTPDGLRLVGFEENGAIVGVLEQLGSGQAKTVLLESDAHDGPGLPLPAAKLALKHKAKPLDAASDEHK